MGSHSIPEICPLLRGTPLLRGSVLREAPLYTHDSMQRVWHPYYFINIVGYKLWLPVCMKLQLWIQVY